tara:strand:- start:1774 stop:2217 length:444 start_codon:yes stop_codon:yes gene_type:complete
MIKVDISCDPVNILKPNETKIKKIIKTVYENENVYDFQISIIFTNDELVSSLKKSFFKINELTDVIAFRLNDYSEKNVEGEVYISVERVFYNAKKYNEKKTNEISRVLIHGILHLLNYKDNEKESKDLMTSKENHYLTKVDCECFNV